MTENDLRTIARELPPGFALASGAHDSPDDGLCLMEAVAYVAGEPHSDSPACACPVLAAFGRRLSDQCNDEERQLLAPLIPRLVGTRSTPEVERRRSYVMADAVIREIVPMALDVVEWADLAARLRAIAPIVDAASAMVARAVTAEVRDASRKRRGAACDAADAAYAADAAAYAAYAAASAAASADAASAAADAAADDARRPAIDAAVRAFERAIAVTE